MLVYSLVFDHVSAVSINLAAMAIGWSWWTAFAWSSGPSISALQAPSCLISGFGQA
jgi:hypothetical protein